MDEETRVLVNGAIGRILRIASRLPQPGDVEEYERCRAIVMDHADKSAGALPYTPNYARDRMKGAQGD